MTKHVAPGARRGPLRILGRLLLLGAVMLSGCVTPSLKRQQIRHAVRAANQPSEQAVLSRFLRSQHATLLPPLRGWFEPSRQAGEHPARRTLGDARRSTLELPLTESELDSELGEHPLLKVERPSGGVLYLLEEEHDPIDSRHFYFARSRTGVLMLITTQRRTLRWHRIATGSMCDSEPFYGPPQSHGVQVVEEPTAALQEFTLSYEGEGIRFRCAATAW